MTNPYLAGPYAPVPDEATVADLPVEGRLPPELEGRYLRNGPNPVGPPEPSRYHWFTGDGMVHGLRLRGGRAEWYRNRWVRSAEVARTLGEEPRPGPVHAGMDFGPNTNVIAHAGRTLALVEGGARPYELTYELDTVGPTDFAGTLAGGYTAHPKRDPSTGELHAVSYFWGWGNKVVYSVVGTDGRVRRSVEVETTGATSVHDMSLTGRYAVVYDLPVVFSVEAAAAGAAFPYRWTPDYPARVGLLPRDGTGVRWFEVEPCYVFHPLNAYDDGDNVVLDVVRHPRMFATRLNGPGEGPPTLERWTVDTAAGRLTEERLDDRPQEFPRVDERVVSRPHRYGYAVGFPPPEDPNGGGLIRHDLRAGTSVVRDMGAGCVAGEAVFVPRTADAAEDDGWVMTFVYDAARDASDLYVLHAGDITGPPAAVVRLPRRVPAGFHGNWVADGE